MTERTPASRDWAELPVGVFDSGVGGLTVVRAINALSPAESIIYLGDTARVPYGTKSPASVRRYAMQVAGNLVEHGIKLLVVACNTASALAVDELASRFAPLPVIGVIRPGAATAVAATKARRIAVLATESTVSQRAYSRTIHELAKDVAVEEIPCSVFVALAEEGWVNGPTAEAAAAAYLGDLRSRDLRLRPDCIVLGCTHFPLLADTIRQALGYDARIVDSATATAIEVQQQLASRNLARAPSAAPGRLTLLATDGGPRFARVGSGFLGRPIAASDVTVVDV